MVKLRETVMKYVFMFSAFLSVLAVMLICLFLFINGIPAMGKIGFFKFLLGREWSPTAGEPKFGIFPMILGSLYITAGAIVAGVPIGLFTAVFMAEFCPKAAYRVLKPAVNLLAGIPSIVYGFFAMVVLVPFVRAFFIDTLGFDGRGNSIFTASLLLGIMILPTVIGITETSVRAVPREIYDGAVALGASRERAVFACVIPAAKSGIMAAVVLGLGRAIGETMAVIMVAGNQPRMPNGLFRGARSLTANIVMEMGYAEGLHNEALIATGVVLFVFILIINTLFSILKKEGPK
jgi:phosphate transport system permease protein